MGNKTLLSVHKAHKHNRLSPINDRHPMSHGYDDHYDDLKFTLNSCHIQWKRGKYTKGGTYANH